MMVSPKFEPIKQEKISTKIAEQIKALINNGDLKPGDTLPPERELVKFFNVSRASLREALNALAGMGFLEVSQKHRTIVKSLTSGRITDPLHHLLKEDIQTVFELIEVRKAIESWSAYHAAKRATADDIANLEKSVESMRVKIEQDISVLEDDANFHLAISEATHNKIQTHLMFSIYDILKESLGKYYENIKMREVYKQHCKVVEAIKKRDSALASRRMHEHLDYVETNVKELAAPDRKPSLNSEV
jgi:GntR family transcriptional regulator, transcriptional repressor for pyruvate dehydrogenase complex